MYENGAAMGQLTCCPDVNTLENFTCGQNLERKIAEQKMRLESLESALEEMKQTGLYNVKISTLRDTMSY